MSISVVYNPASFEDFVRACEWMKEQGSTLPAYVVPKLNPPPVPPPGIKPSGRQYGPIALEYMQGNPDVNRPPQGHIRITKQEKYALGGRSPSMEELEEICRERMAREAEGLDAPSGEESVCTRIDDGEEFC